MAKFYLGETRSHLRWAVRIIPKRKDNAGREVDLVSILKGMENGPLAQLEAVIKAKNYERFAAAYRFTMENCYACHKAADKPYLRPQIPTGPATQIINFDPNRQMAPVTCGQGIGPSGGRRTASDRRSTRPRDQRRFALGVTSGREPVFKPREARGAGREIGRRSPVRGALAISSSAMCHESSRA